MALDGTSIVHAPKQLPVASAGLGYGISNRTVEPGGPRPVPARLWSRRPGNLSSALGVLMQAGCELGLGAEGASAALRGQICRPIEDWNDHPQRTHAEVIAAFEATIAALASCPA